MSKDYEDPPTVTATVAEAEAEAETETGQPDTHNKMMQYIAGILRLFASIFFTCAAVFFHPDVNARGRKQFDKVGAFFMTGFVLLGAALAVELYMKRDKDPMIVGAISVTLLAVVLLFIAGILTLSEVIIDIETFNAFAGCFHHWIVDSHYLPSS